jgi:hypothetical protein
MERELWPRLYQLVTEVGATITQKYVHHQPWVPALVLLWAAIHDRSIRWACDRRNWAGAGHRVPTLPAPSTVSRRLRSVAVGAVLRGVEDRLRAAGGHPALAALVDGKPVEVSGVSTDPDAAPGRAAGRMGRGHKLHATWAGRAVPEAWDVTRLSAAESVVAGELVGRAGGGGYLVGDGNYDSGPRFDAAAAAGYQLVVPADDPAAGRGHRRVSRHRRRGLELARSAFGRALLRHRRRIESGFGALVSFAGGLGGLPAWVRRAWRVRNWVWAKLLINGARILRRQRLAAQME